MKFNSVTPVILGFLSFESMSGYEIKQRVDRSTRFFWAASYGQIYPELRRLAQASLVEGESSPRGGRQRNVYTLTEAGRTALAEWLSGPSLQQEVRDEALLKLFFAEALEPEATLALVRAIGERHRDRREQLLSIEPIAAAGSTTRHLVLKAGLAFHAAGVEWADDSERRLIEEGPR